MNREPNTYVRTVCVTGIDYRTKAADLYAAYAVSQRKFGSSLGEKGFEKYTNNGTWYKGVAVSASHRPTE